MHYYYRYMYMGTHTRVSVKCVNCACYIYIYQSIHIPVYTLTVCDECDRIVGVEVEVLCSTTPPCAFYLYMGESFVCVTFC